ncbi:MAG: hypothetical protein KDE47_30160, partial [Caldilineaceae bacterium]|nr:hypothetical protein [Caldilineaceae bacterium]
GLARIFVENGEYEQTDELLLECQEYFTRQKNLHDLAKTIRLRGIVEFRVGQYEQASTYAQQALQIQQHNHFMPDMIDTLRLLTDLALAQRNYPEVYQCCKRAMQLLERDAYPAELGETYLSLAQYYRRLKSWDEAVLYAEESQRLFKRIGKRAFLAYALFEQCIAQAEAGELAAGIATGQKSLTIMAALDDGYNRVVALKVVGDFYNRAGQRTHARTTWQEGHELAQTLHHPMVEQFQERLLEA